MTVLPRAVVFDFDGTIIDTESPEYRSWSEVYRRFGLELPLDRWAQGVGAAWGIFDPLDDLERRLGTALDREAVAAWRAQRDRQLILAEGVRPGILDLLAEMAQHGIPAAIASSSPRSWVDEHLARLGLERYFPVICTIDDGAPAKPAPDLYQLACRRLGVEPSLALAIEDSPNGAMAARSAGLPCVVVPNQVTALLSFPEHQVVLETLQGVSLARLWRAAAGDGSRPGDGYRRDPAP